MFASFAYRGILSLLNLLQATYCHFIRQMAPVVEQSQRRNCSKI